MITDIADYFSKGCGRCPRFATPDCSTRRWIAGLHGLRQICVKAGLVETVKWGHPCYVHNGRNIALLGAFRDDFRMTFFNAALMKDPDAVLEKQGPNTQHAGMIRFVDSAHVARMEPIILAYLDEAIGYAEAGVEPSKDQNELELPGELLEALGADPELDDAFRSLTPGRQRSYVIALNSAKTSATRMSRIAKFRDRIIAGKGANER
jgi:uncharacterized protein YdeI (YjbR/CyaY-like superfamily)